MVKIRQILKLGFKTRRYEIDEEDLRKGTFELLTNRRQLSSATVKSIFENLSKGQHFDSSFVVNLKNGKYRLIDGNHRYEAIVRYLAAFPKNRVEVLLHIYEDMDEDAEKHLYTTYNLGRKQSVNDFVQQYKDEIPIWNTISDQKKFPVRVSVYPSPGSVTFYHLVGAYIISSKPRFPGAYVGRPLDFVHDTRMLAHSDINLMAQYMNEFLQAFGPVRNNHWLKSTPLNATMKIWMDNRDHINPKTMITLFRRRLANDAAAIDLGKPTGMSAGKYARDKFLIMLNEGRKNDIFIDKDKENEDTLSELEDIDTQNISEDEQ